MYLKSLELHGFKSFPNRTTLTFERGATVIVGPNGSGKSNISDAMRWVLGELSSRNIRGTKMEDIIFGGTDERRPMGFAEVSVTFDNTDQDNRLDIDCDEVTVTRRYYRTGDSEYLINKESKRLRDIHTLFMNTGVGREGYSIIGQGKVAEIISKKSDDRRTIFEEAAGISKYRARKEESERKLTNVSENLDRINDIKTVLEERVGPLEKEAERAKKGLAVYEEKKKIDVSLWLYDTKKIREDIEEAENAWKLSKHELEIVQQLMQDLEQQTENLYNKTQSSKIKSSELLQKMQETTEKLHELDNSMRVAESDFAHSAEMIQECKNRIAEIEKSESTIGVSKNEYENKKSDAESKIKELSDARLEILYDAQKKSEEIEKIKKDLEHALEDLTVEENNATDLKVRIDVLKNAKVTDGTKSVSIEQEIEQYEKEGEKLKAEAERCEKNASGFKNQIAVHDETIDKSVQKIDDLSVEKNQISDRLNELKLQKNETDQRADVLERMNEHFSGYMESVKFVMKEYNAGNISGNGTIYGPLSSLVSVEGQYITAIDTALGSSLQNIVVEHEGTAKAAMFALKKANAGRATFYPISAMRSPRESDESKTASMMKGCLGRADKLVKTQDKFKNIIEFLLLRTLVFDNIDNASDAAKRIGYRVKMVTLDGQVINAGGSFTGGSAKHDSGILSRGAEIKKFRQRSNELSVKIKEVVEALNEINSELEENIANRNSAQQQKELLLTLSRAQFAALDNANANYNANCNILQRLKQDYENLQNNQGRADEEIISLNAEQKATSERIESLKNYRSKRSLEMGAEEDIKDELTSKANDLYIKITESRKDLEAVLQMLDSINQRLLELDDEKKQQNEKIDSLNNKRNNIDNVKAEHKAEYEELETLLENLKNERAEVESGTDEFEKEMNELREKMKQKTNSQSVIMDSCYKNESRYNQLVEKQNALGSQLWDDYEITYQDAIDLDYPPVSAENRDETAKLQVALKNKLRNIGNFNPNAIEEYAVVKTQYDDLNTQYIDLTKSQEELYGIIGRIESEMRTSFIDAFNAINKNFAITFKELFGGGHAELSLTDPEDVLTSGIEINATPPGKLISKSKMSLLSGGEQSFVAIALLFAIIKVNPTPFCILDEIEAALDEVNVMRFGNYIRKLSDETQFILITHRRGTMEVGDKLYGVTMPQRGISQAIELNVNEIEGKQKEILDGVL